MDNCATCVPKLKFSLLFLTELVYQRNLLRYVECFAWIGLHTAVYFRSHDYRFYITNA